MAFTNLMECTQSVKTDGFVISLICDEKPSKKPSINRVKGSFVMQILGSTHVSSTQKALATSCQQVTCCVGVRENKTELVVSKSMTSLRFVTGSRSLSINNPRFCRLQSAPGGQGRGITPLHPFVTSHLTWDPS